MSPRFRVLSTEHGLSQSSVFCMAQDKNGFVWIGTRSGLNRYDGYSFINYKYNPQDTTSLSNNEIISLLVDFKGDIWIGTRGGGLNMYSYKTNNFIRYDNLNYENIIDGLYQSSDSVLWIGSSEGLLQCSLKTGVENYKFENVSKTSIYRSPEKELLVHSKNILAINSICAISKDSLAVGTRSGVFIFDRKKRKFDRIDIGYKYQDVVTSVVTDLNGTLWIGSFDGMVKAVPKKNGKGYIFKYFNTDEKGDGYISTNRIEDLITDNNGNVWAGTRGGGLIMLNSSNKMSVYLNDVFNINSISENIINSILIDNNDALWIGTESQGCCILDLKSKKFAHIRYLSNYPDITKNNLITSITGGNENAVWVGSATNGVDKIIFDKENTYKTRYLTDIPVNNNKVSKEVISLLLDSKNNLWIGAAANHLCKYTEGKGSKIYPTAGYVFCIHEDKQKRIWFGTWGQGLGMIDPGSDKIITFNSSAGNRRSLTSDRILSLFDDNSNNLWVGTKGGGLNVYPVNLILSSNDAEFISFRHNPDDNKTLSHDDILCIFQDSKNIIWIGTGGGLNKVLVPADQNFTDAILKGDLSFFTYLEKDGLPNDVIYGILEDKEGNLWLSTNNGLSKFNPGANTFKNYGVNDGLQANEFIFNAYYKGKKGKMFFGGVNGLTVFNPDSIKDNFSDLKVVITGLRIQNQIVKPQTIINGKKILNDDISNSKMIELSYKEKEITLEFSALYFTNPQQVKYSYRLLGFNENWTKTEPNIHAVTYTNLFDGEYIFQVKSDANDNSSDNLITELKIRINPPFWRTPWFYLIYISVIVFGLIVFRRYSLIAVKEKNRLHIESIEHKKLTEITEAKMRFFTNISHEIRTPLTLISDPIEQVLSEGKIDEVSRKNILLVSKNVKRLLNLVNQLIKLRKLDLGFLKPKISEVEIVPFVKEIIGNFEQQVNLKHIYLGFDTEDDNITTWIDKDLMSTVFYNLFSNAFKYTPENKSIKINIYRKEGIVNKGFYSDLKEKIKKKKIINNWIVIEIIDAGKGIPQSELKKIFYRFYQVYDNIDTSKAGSGIGLSLVKEYVELHKGYVDVTSILNEGSNFTIYLPEGSNHIEKDWIIKTESQEIIDENNLNEDLTEINNIVENIENENIQSKGTILIIEDDTELSVYLKDYFNKRFNVIIESDGNKGLEKAIEIIPDLIISDIMVPGITGIELCNQLKSSVETSHIPVILLSAMVSDENILEGYEKGADSYVTKPFKIKILEKQVDRLITSRKELRDKYSKQVFLRPKEVTITSTDERFLQQLMDITENNIANEDFDVSRLVSEMNMGHATILKKVKALTGIPMVEFIKNYRLKKAAMIMQKEKFPIAEVGYMVGFSDPKYFSKCFVKQFGKTPSEYSNEFHSKKI